MQMAQSRQPPPGVYKDEHNPVSWQFFLVLSLSAPKKQKWDEDGDHGSLRCLSRIAARSDALIVLRLFDSPLAAGVLDNQCWLRIRTPHGGHVTESMSFILYCGAPDQIAAK